MEPESKGMEASLWLLQVIASLTDCHIHSPLPMSRNSTLKGNCSHASHSYHLQYTLPTNYRLSDSHRRIRGFPSVYTEVQPRERKKERKEEREREGKYEPMFAFILFFLENLSIEAFHLTP